MVRNFKLGTPTGTLNSETGDNRKVYLPTDQGSANTYVFTNTKVGYQFNLSLQARQNFRNGFFAMAAYNYLIAKDASSISAEISSDAFDRNPILNNANEANLSTSLYGNTHQVLLQASKSLLTAALKTSLPPYPCSVPGRPGNRFAYVYGGDINNDGTASNDLLFVPTNADIDNMNFAPVTDVLGNVKSASEQKAALKNFIAQDDYLNSRRGKYTEKYAGENPWISQLDMRILQDFKLGKNNKTFQISLDFVNLGNFFNSNWGDAKICHYFRIFSAGIGHLQQQCTGLPVRSIADQNLYYQPRSSLALADAGRSAIRFLSFQMPV